MISHIEAQALISARMDGPLDPIAVRELQAHIATCDICRAFANQTAAMTQAFHELPYLPASPSVSRAVMEHVQRPTSVWGMTQQWLTPNLGSALSTVAALVVVAALSIFVLTRVVNQGGHDGHQNTQVLTAPSQETGNGLALGNLTPKATVPAAVSTQGQPTIAAPTAEANTVASTTGAAVPTATSSTETAPGPSATTAPADTGQIVVPTDVTTTEPTVVPTSEQKQALVGAEQSGQGAARTAAGASTAVPLPTWTPLPASTATLSPTETQAPEPTATLEPSATLESTDTPSPEPSPTAESILRLVPSETPSPEQTATSTSTPFPTDEPTQTLVPTETVTQDPTPTPSPAEGDQIIEPANGSVEAADQVPTSVVGETQPTATMIPPAASSNQPTIAGNDGTGGSDQVIVPATGEQASPNLGEAPSPVSTSPEVAPTSGAGEQVIVPKGGDNQRGGQQGASNEATPIIDQNGGNPTATPPSEVSAPEGDLSAARVLGPFTGGAGARLVYDNGTVGVSSVPNAAPLQSADGVSLQEQPAKNGTSVFACTAAGSCVDATSDSADGEHTDTAIGWVNGSTMIYQRMLVDGSYEYHAANVTGGGNASGDQVIGAGRAEMARSGSVCTFRDGLLVESNCGWVIVTAQQAYLQPASSSGPRTLVRIVNIDPMRVAYVSGGELVIQNIYSSDVTTIPFTGVDYDLSPNLDQVVVSTGSGIEILDMSGQVVETFPNAQNISVGSVLWVNNTIEFVDLNAGEIRSIDVP
ncbi:MAG: zf-HC2 domain-containing protein, partial [Thermomicrobiales bacterium]